jgi:beta-N-acetylhexosaminidase
MLIIGLSGTTLTDADRARLAAPQVSGAILFTRNFQDRDQLVALVDDIRLVRDEPFLVCVDQEGGPVQRFRDGFAPLPALARLGELYARDPRAAVARTEEHAWLMASEMRAIGIDLSFAPVVDLARGNRAIGERAFAPDPEVVSDLGQAYLRGMHLAGMAATLKHFPGHGSVAEDTHFDAASDPRDLDTLLATDLVPFADAIAAGAAGSVGGRVRAHLDAGCDLVLACSPSIVDEAIQASAGMPPCDGERLQVLQGGVAQTWEALESNPQRGEFIARLVALADAGSNA